MKWERGKRFFSRIFNRKSKEANEGDKPLREGNGYDVEQRFVCARCKKPITENECVWIGNHRFCTECTKPLTSAQEMESEQRNRSQVPSRDVWMDRLQEALDNDTFLDFIKGKGEYFIPDRDQYRKGTTDTGRVIYHVYEYCRNNPNSNIGQLLETTLLDLLKGSEYDLMLSFDYSCQQFGFEASKLAPFRFHQESYRALQIGIEKNKKKLLKYKDWYEFGNYLEGGAYEWAQCVGQAENTKYQETGRFIAMHTDNGVRYAFRVHEQCSEGGGGRSGYCWQTWRFFCHANGVPYLLTFSDCSEGCGWFACPLSQEDVMKIVWGPSEDKRQTKKNAVYWLWDEIEMEHIQKQETIRFLHPDDIAAARELLRPDYSWHGKLTDEEIEGRNPESSHSR